MKKKASRTIQKIVAASMIVIGIMLQIYFAGAVFNGATILSVLITVAGITLLIFDFVKIKNWIKREFLNFYEYEFEELDVIPWVVSSEEEETKEGIIIKFPEMSDK